MYEQWLLQMFVMAIVGLLAVVLLYGYRRRRKKSPSAQGAQSRFDLIGSSQSQVKPSPQSKTPHPEVVVESPQSKVHADTPEFKSSKSIADLPRSVEPLELSPRSEAIPIVDTSGKSTDASSRTPRMPQPIRLRDLEYGQGSSSAASRPQHESTEYDAYVKLLEKKWLSRMGPKSNPKGELPSFCSEMNFDFPLEYSSIEDKLESTSENFIVTGGAGTGKTTLIKHFICNTRKRFAVVSPTGVAAVNVGGQTIHSFFAFPPGPITFDKIKRSRRDVLKTLDVLIVDEVSMVRADLLDGIDMSLRLNRDAPDAPFGGVQVILVGDPLQLPPVVSTREEAEFFSTFFASPFFFDAKCYDEAKFHHVVLEHNFRQAEDTFVQILNRIRIGKQVENDLDWLNKTVDSGFDPEVDSGYVVLTPTRARASAINQRNLDRLGPPEMVYEAEVKGTFDPKYYPTDYHLRLRVGAQVMFLVNDSGMRFVNGTVGHVRALAEDKIVVEVQKSSHRPEYIIEVGKYKFEVPEYKINYSRAELQTRPKGTFEQFPLQLAWAITIHKAQGTTLERAVIDLSTGVFAPGQSYVALSRLVSSAGLVLRRPIRMQDLYVDVRIRDFMRRQTQLF